MSVFGIVPPEVPVIRSLEDCAPIFRARMEAVMIDLVAKGFDPILSETLRTDDRQEWLFGFGRDYDDGRGVITNAPTGRHSWHFYGLAADVISRKDRWDASPAFWRSLGECCRLHGLSWGGDWVTFRDLPHCQMGHPMRQSPSKRAWELYQQGGRAAVWKEIFG